MSEVGNTSSIHWPMLAATFLAVAAVFIGLAIRATRCVLRRYDVRPVGTVIWIAVIWLVPVLGALLAMSSADSITTEKRTSS